MTKTEIVLLAMDYCEKPFSGKYFLNIPTELTDEAVFTCPECGEKVAFNDLEFWSTDSFEDLLADKIICSQCYENEMGDDL